MALSEKQRAAHQLASDYLSFLAQQEAVVDRLFCRKWKEIEPQIEQLIERKIKEYLAS